MHIYDILYMIYLYIYFWNILYVYIYTFFYLILIHFFFFFNETTFLTKHPISLVTKIKSLLKLFLYICESYCEI